LQKLVGGETAADAVSFVVAFNEFISRRDCRFIGCEFDFCEKSSSDFSLSAVSELSAASV
jgi:hypothetical protein